MPNPFAAHDSALAALRELKSSTEIVAPTAQELDEFHALMARAFIRTVAKGKVVSVRNMAIAEWIVAQDDAKQFLKAVSA